MLRNTHAEKVRQVFEWPSGDPWLSEEESWMPDFKPVDIVGYATGEGMVSSYKEAELLRGQKARRLAETIPVSVLLNAANIAMDTEEDDIAAGRLLAGAFCQQDLASALAGSVGLPAESIILAVRALIAAKIENTSEKLR